MSDSFRLTGRQPKLDYTKYVNSSKIAYRVADNDVKVYVEGSNGIPQRGTVSSYSKVRIPVYEVWYL